MMKLYFCFIPVYKRAFMVGKDQYALLDSGNYAFVDPSGVRSIPEDLAKRQPVVNLFTFASDGTLILRKE
jgi:hypothetical protein